MTPEIDVTDPMVNAVRAFVPAPCSRTRAERAARAVIAAYRASLILADTPRMWDLPPEPGPEVRAVRTRHGALYRRVADGWDEHGGAGVFQWAHLMRYCSMPLTDATAEVTAETGASA